MDYNNFHGHIKKLAKHKGYLDGFGGDIWKLARKLIRYNGLQCKNINGDQGK